MGSITFVIRYGTPPFDVHLREDCVPPVYDVVPPLIGVGRGEHTFYDIPGSECSYTVIVQDSVSCGEDVGGIVVPTTTTTTTDPDATTTTTTTDSEATTTTTTTIIYPTVECLDGMRIEMLYIHLLSELALLPVGYTHPCPANIGSHGCDRALFELYGNGIYLGDSRMNNIGGTGGGQTEHSGNFICEDYHNYPDALTGGPGTWLVSGGSSYSRYDSITLTREQAIYVAMANQGGTTIALDYAPAMTTYGKSCDFLNYPHKNITWIRVFSPVDDLLYEGCPNEYFLTVDICPTTTTTTILP